MDIPSTSKVVSMTDLSTKHKDKLNCSIIRTINDLPQEMLVEIFSYLSVEDLVFCIKQVCERWAEVSQDPGVWKHVAYKPSDGTPLDQVMDVLTQASKLETFYASSKHGTDVNVLQAAGINCKSIKKLSLSVDMINYNYVGKILTCELNHCIEELHISLLGIGGGDLLFDGFNFDEKELLNSIGKCVNLQSLTLSGIVLHSDYFNFFEGIAVGCPKLQELNILFLCGFSQHDLEFFLKSKGKQLLSLTLDWNWSRLRSTLPAVSRFCPKLEKLGVGCYSYKPTKLPDVLKNSKIIPDDIEALKHMPFLKELSIPHHRNSSLCFFVDLFENGQFCQLTKLNLSFVDCVNKQLLWVIFQNCQTLKHLNFMGCSKIVDDGLETIDSLKELESVNIARCSRVTDEGVSHIIKCKTLRSLNLNFCPNLTIRSLKRCFQNLKFLYEIHFNSCFIDEKDLLSIPNHLHRFLEPSK